MLFTQKVITTNNIRMVNTILKYCMESLYSLINNEINLNSHMKRLFRTPDRFMSFHENGIDIFTGPIYIPLFVSLVHFQANRGAVNAKDTFLPWNQIQL